MSAKDPTPAERQARRRAIMNMRHKIELWRDGDSASLYLEVEELPVLRSILAKAEAEEPHGD